MRFVESEIAGGEFGGRSEYSWDSWEGMGRDIYWAGHGVGLMASDGLFQLQRFTDLP